jgi:hypothetical protein
VRVNVKYVSLISAFKMGCAFTLVTTLFLSVPYLFCSLFGLIPLLSMAGLASIKGLPSILANSYVAIVLLAILGAFSVAISWAFAALIYNVAAVITGGLNIKLARRERIQKNQKEANSEDEDPMVQTARKNLERAEAFARQKIKHT